MLNLQIARLESLAKTYAPCCGTLVEGTRGAQKELRSIIDTLKQLQPEISQNEHSLSEKAN